MYLLPLLPLPASSLPPLVYSTYPLYYFFYTLLCWKIVFFDERIGIQLLMRRRVHQQEFAVAWKAVSTTDPDKNDDEEEPPSSASEAWSDSSSDASFRHV